MEYRVIDTHCHPQFPQYDADRDQVIRRTLDAGIGMVCVGTDAETSRQAVELAKLYEGVWCSVGLHPNDGLDEAYDPTSYELLATDPKVVAIGEVGLDYYRTTDPEKKKFQRERFERQLILARSLGKPVIVHCRDAHADMRDVLNAHEGMRGVIHSFTGTTTDALHYIERGFFIGFNGIVTFPPRGGQAHGQYDDVVLAIPLDRLLLETDSPYLAPASRRGKRNEPGALDEIAVRIGEIRSAEFRDICRSSRANSRTLFGI